MLFSTQSAVSNFVAVFATVYIFACILYVITLMVRLPYSLRSVQRFLYDVCDPYLRLWRRLLPFSAGPIDISPMVAIVALGVVASIVVAIVNRI
jgi:YggT family protein